MAATAITSISITSITADRLTGTISDLNSSNEELDAYYVYLSGSKVAYDSTESPLVITSQSTGYGSNYFDQLTSATDAVFTFNIPADGWYKFIYIAAPEWDVSTAFSEFDVAVDPNDGRFYQANQAVTGGSSPMSASTEWDLVPTPSSLLTDVGESNDPGNIYYQEFNTIQYPNTNKAFGDKAALASLECCSDCKREEDVEVYELLSVFRWGMNISNTRQLYSNGEKIARRASQIL